MSAWAELVGERDGDEWLELCSRALEEVQRETSRRNAETIQRDADEVWAENWRGGTRDKRSFVGGMRRGARIISPEATP
ncbi:MULTISPECIES: hypothetical protein [unclassified Streptomyces]|uniref:hypothetical protein n=1 Tax=unclassified Streptomyces TaxID=2593676 RepID=UPI0033DB8AF9